MKKNFILLVVVFLIFIQFSKFNPAEMEVVYSSMTGTKNYSLYLTVILNEKRSGMFEDYAKKIVQRCCDNTFENIDFSYDYYGLPHELEVVAYLNSKEYEQKQNLFSFTYTSSKPDSKISESQLYTIEIKKGNHMA